MSGLRVIVCGGRTYKDRATVFEELDRIVRERGPIDVIIHGESKGADRLANLWAEARNITVIAVPADWERYKRAAGPIRNRKMITDHAPDLVIAFPGGTGTANMIGLAHLAFLEVIEVGE